MIRLVDGIEYDAETDGGFTVLTWQLLKERDDSVNISHKKIPAMESHAEFVAHHPYRTWEAIMAGETPVGSVYLTKRNEIGIFILQEHQGKGYAKAAIKKLLGQHRPLPGIASFRPGAFVANVNPANQASIRLFESLGAKHISNTYQL